MRQIRRCVFETNSSATHSLTLYKKDEWKKIKNGECLVDDGYKYRKGNQKFSSKEEIKNSAEYEKWLGLYRPDYEEYTDEELLEEYMLEEAIYTYDDYREKYDVLEEEVPDSDYVAISIFSYE